MMFKEDVLKLVKREIAIFLIDNNFYKFKRQFRRDFKDALCLFEFSRVRGEGNDDTIVLQFWLGIFFNILNPIYRAHTTLDQYVATDADKNLSAVGTGRGPELGLWEVRSNADVGKFIAEFKDVYAPIFAALDMEACPSLSIDHTVSRIGMRNLVAAPALVKAAVMAKILHRKNEYLVLKKEIECRSENDVDFFKKKIAMTDR